MRLQKVREVLQHDSLKTPESVTSESAISFKSSNP